MFKSDVMSHPQNSLFDQHFFFFLFFGTSLYFQVNIKGPLKKKQSKFKGQKCSYLFFFFFFFVTSLGTFHLNSLTLLPSPKLKVVLGYGKSHPRNKMSDLSADISSKCRISVGTDTILPIESRFARKSVKASIFRRNIESTWHAHVS